MSKKSFIVFIAITLCCVGVSRAQIVALKTDVLGWATASFNIEPEVRIGKKATLALGVSYNPWTFNDANMKWKHIFVQPEFRFWTCHAFDGHFFGIHPFYAHYNIGGIRTGIGFLQDIEKYRHQGDAFGLGVGYGYHWIITPHFSMEAELGIGVAYADGIYHYAEVCGSYIGEERRWVFMPTKLSVSFIYVIR